MIFIILLPIISMMLAIYGIVLAVLEICKNDKVLKILDNRILSSKKCQYQSCKLKKCQ